MPSSVVCRCPSRLMRRCFLGRWICRLVSERFRLVWQCCLFGCNTYIRFCLHWHGGQCQLRLVKNVESSIKQVLATTPHETPTIRTLAPHHKNYTSSTNQTRRTLLEKQGRAHKRCTPVDPHSWMCKSGTTSTNLHTAAMWGHGL